jgi:hypothetical protein
MVAELRAFLKARSFQTGLSTEDPVKMVAAQLRTPDGQDTLHRFCSHQFFSTNSDHGRDQEVSPARKRVHTSRTALTLIGI